MILNIEIDTKIVDAFCIAYSYQAKIPAPTESDPSAMQDNPVSREEFTKQKIIDFIKEIYRAYRINTEVEATVKEVETTVKKEKLIIDKKIINIIKNISEVKK